MKFKTWDQAGMPEHMVNTSKDGWGPRLGFAYRAGDGAKSFVVRGGYRISYFHFVMGGWAARMRMNAPMTARFYGPWGDPEQGSYSPDGIGNWWLRNVPQFISGQNTTDLVLPSRRQKPVPRLLRGVLLQPGHARPARAGLEPDLREGDHGQHGGARRLLRQPLHAAGAEVRFQRSHPGLRLVQDHSYPDAHGRVLPGGPAARSRTPTWAVWSAGRTPAGATPTASSSNWSAATPRAFAYQIFYVMDNNMMAGGEGYDHLEHSRAEPVHARRHSHRHRRAQPAAELPARHHASRSTACGGTSWWTCPFGKGKPIMGNAGKWLNRLVGGWQIAGMGSLAST